MSLLLSVVTLSLFFGQIRSNGYKLYYALHRAWFGTQLCFERVEKIHHTNVLMLTKAVKQN